MRRRLAWIAAALAVALFAPLLLPRVRADERKAVPTTRRDSVRDFDLPDLAGKRHTMAAYRDAKAIVLAWTAPGCPVAQVYAPRLVALSKAWAERGVRFLGVESDTGISLDEVKRSVEESGVPYPVLLDADGELAQRLGAKTTTAVVLLDQNRRVRYRGALDDQYGVSGRKAAPTKEWLKDALDAVLSARAVETAETDAPGCPITFPTAAAPAKDGPTWSDGVGAIVHRRCATCHRPGEGGPFSLLQASDVRGRTATLHGVVSEGRMPPWGADAPFGTFTNDRRLRPEEKATLLAWLDAGAPEGDPKKAPTPPPARSVDGWEIGKPDAILAFPEAQKIPAEGVVPYRFIEVPTDFPEDRWVQAVEVSPGAPDVVHHVLVATMEPGTRRRAVLFDPLRGFFAAMVPGGRALSYPAGLAKRLPKGAVLLFQMHYTPNGVATEDRTRIGMIFAKEPPEHEVLTAGAFEPRIRIPPGAANHHEVATLPVPWDVKVLSFMPHAHVRATSFRYEVVKIGGTPKTLLDVPRYDFNWQTPYVLAEPIPVSKGSFLRVHVTYDNSAENPYNPDPTTEVRWGDQTWEEMLIGYVDYVKVP